MSNGLVGPVIGEVYDGDSREGYDSLMREGHQYLPMGSFLCMSRAAPARTALERDLWGFAGHAQRNRRRTWTIKTVSGSFATT